jgi:hypothetical protein
MADPADSVARRYAAVYPGTGLTLRYSIKSHR